LSWVPKGFEFMTIASFDFVTCGIQKDGLVLDCWFFTFLIMTFHWNCVTWAFVLLVPVVKGSFLTVQVFIVSRI
jgi:hypothetical protein